MRAPGHCEKVQFIGGLLETKDPAVIDVIDKAITAGGSGFGRQAVTAGPEEAEMKADIKALAEVAQTKMVKAGLATA
jgi:hypothetical protein